MKKIKIVWILVLTLSLLSFVCMMSFCTEMEDLDEPVKVFTSKEFLEAINSGKELILLENNITITEDVTISNSVNIDLQNHEITFISKSQGICINKSDATWLMNVLFGNNIDKHVNIKNGSIYASTAENAIRLYAGVLYLENMRIYGGDGYDGILFGDSGMSAIDAIKGRVSLNKTYVSGGNGGYGLIKSGRKASGIRHRSTSSSYDITKTVMKTVPEN